MTFNQRASERGASLLIALVMLLILSVLAVSSMRGVVLESRITANRAESQRLQSAAEAALREAEFRLLGPDTPDNLRAKLEPDPANCRKDNKLQANGDNRPCLLDIADEDDRLSLMLDPLAFLRSSSAPHTTGAAANAAADSGIVAWMPYRGTQPGDDNATTTEYDAYWNIHLIAAGKADGTAVNAEYGAALEGKGTYFYLINGQADDRLVLQSTIANVYVGLNN